MARRVRLCPHSPVMNCFILKFLATVTERKMSSLSLLFPEDVLLVSLHTGVICSRVMNYCLQIWTMVLKWKRWNDCCRLDLRLLLNSSSTDEFKYLNALCTSEKGSGRWLDCESVRPCNSFGYVQCSRIMRWKFWLLSIWNENSSFLFAQAMCTI